MLVHDFIVLKENEIPLEIDYRLFENSNSTKISDDFILENWISFNGFKAKWVETDDYHNGLAYHDITIIPLESIQILLSNLTNIKTCRDQKALVELCHRSLQEEKNIIHHGI